MSNHEGRKHSMKWEAGAFRNPMARARGLGQSHHGVGHWVLQRATAVSNLILILWMMLSVVSLVGKPYADVQAWLSSPVSAVFVILFLVSTLYHAALGIQIAIEDYVHCELRKLASLWAVRFVVIFLAVTGIFSVLKAAL